MNEQQRKAMELALEALDFSTSSSPCVEELQDDAIAAIKEALAQRTWVGLSQEDFIYFCSYVRNDVLSEIEAKLKELNT